MPPARNWYLETIKYLAITMRIFGILEVVKKCCEDGKIFLQHNIHAEFN